MFNIQQLMKQAQVMQKKAEEMQNELKNTNIETQAGGGVVTVTLNAKNEFVSIKIKPEAINPENPASVDAEEEKDNSVIYILIGAGILVVGLIIAGVVMIRRRNDIIVPEFDENGAVIIDDDEEIWVDESLVIEDAFPDAKPAGGADKPQEAVGEDQDNDLKLAEALEEADTEADNTADFSMFD